MIKVSNKLYSFIALLFVTLTVFGYQIATSLFLPVMSDSNALSQAVTYPYRGVMLLLAVVLIILRPLKPVVVENRNASRLLVFFFVVYCARILFDIFVQNVYVIPSWRVTTIQFIFLSLLPSLWAATKCAPYLEYERLNKWLLWCSIIMLGLLIINQNSLIKAEYDDMTRVDANIAMNTISLGHICVTVFFVLFSWILSHNRRQMVKFGLLVMMLISVVIMLRAASRGPLVAFVVMLLFIVIASTKNKIVAGSLSTIFIVLFIAGMDDIISLIGRISPIMEQRISAAAFEGDSSGRNSLYANAIDVFLRNPILGDKFVLDIGFYAHNSVLDVLMGLGIVGGSVWVYLFVKDFIVSYRHILYRSSLMIIGLLSIQMLVKTLFSGSIYTDNELVVFMAIVLLHPKTMSDLRLTNVKNKTIKL